MYKAVFFDRDNTLTCADPKVQLWRNEKFLEWIGHPVQMSYEDTMDLFKRAGRPESGVKSVEEEIAFWHRYWRCLLEGQGVTKGLDEKAAILHEGTWLKGRVLFPESRAVVEAFRSKGFQIGVISDTDPSLQLTLEALDMHFDCYICSGTVGVMKPDPLIYQTALDALNVKAEESLYVDDYDVEADGARAMGFTAFHICRNQPIEKPWQISSLQDMVRYVDEHA